MPYLFDPAPQPALPISGQDKLFPVHRIFCVGRNYAAHAAEMGGEVDREAPFYFTKSPHHIALSPAETPVPPGTEDYHHEIELVVALGRSLRNASAEEAGDAVLAYGTGLDMTRRDLQAQAKEKRRPWDVGKDVEGSAVLGALTPAPQLDGLGDRRIALTVNGELRQEGKLSEMVWPVDALLAHLSTLYRLQPGDLVMMGTPSGVGPVVAGDRLEGTIEGLRPVSLTLTA